MRTVIRWAGRVAIVTVAFVLCLALVVIAILTVRAIMPPSLSYLAAPLLLILLGAARTAWPNVRNRYGRRLRDKDAGMADDPKPSASSDTEVRPAANPPIDPVYVARIMDEAAQLPLLDAAFYLWTHKYYLDRSEGMHPSVKRPPPDLNDPEIFGETVREAFRKVFEDRINAHTGSTFAWLRKLYPGASPEELQQSIKAAVKLDEDCVRNFSYKSDNYFDDVTNAVNTAGQANPGFQDKTYKEAWYQLAHAMR